MKKPKVGGRATMKRAEMMDKTRMPSIKGMSSHGKSGARNRK